jgi:YggT family protein
MSGLGQQLWAREFTQRDKMAAYILVQLINFLATAITMLMFAYAILSWVAKPWNKIRLFVDRISEPLLAPIRRVVPLVGMVDISPLVLILLVQLLSRLLIYLIYAVL